MNDILTISEHQEIYVAKKRDIEKNTISDDDRKLLFDVKYRDKEGKNRYVFSHKGGNKIKANSIVGSISLKTGLTIEILPKFAKNSLDKESIKQHRAMLLNMIRVSNERNFISSVSQSSKISMNEMPLINYIIELFSDDLLKKLRSGIYNTYNKVTENSTHIRGNILISKTIQNNIIDKSKVYTIHHKHSSNNLLMKIFKTLSILLLKDNNLSYSTKQNLYEITLILGSVDKIELTYKDFDYIVFNRLNDKFEILFKQAKFIFNRYMPFSSHINSSPFWSILFNMDYLFEKFCAYLFRKSDLEIEEQSITKCFDNHKYSVSAKPDFIIKENKNLFDTEIINVVDAKWKLLSKDKSLYGLDAQNFWQLFSYMNLLHKDNELQGYFIVPKNSNDFEDEIIFNPIKEGNKSITILSIDFSLDFEELIEKYRFKIIDDELKLDIKVVEEVVEEIVIEEKKIEEVLEVKEDIEEDFKFDLEAFINELEVLSNNKNIRKKLSPIRKNPKFKNVFYLKTSNNENNKFFNQMIKENIYLKDLILDDLDIKEIPNNLTKLRTINLLSFRDNKLTVLPTILFRLSHLTYLDISLNPFRLIPPEIKNLQLLAILIIDKKIVKDNILLLQILKENKIIIKDEKNKDLSEYINSLIKPDEIKEEIVEVKKEKEKEIILDKAKVETALPIMTFENITLDEYQLMDESLKIKFIGEYDLNLLDDEFIKYIIFNENLNILDELTYSDSLPLKYLVLTYNNYLDNQDIKTNIKKRNHPILNKITSTYLENLPNYIETNFNIIDKEILLGYAMNEEKKLYRVREKISSLTNDLDILNELSKHRDDEQVLFNIVFKSNKDNNSFKNKIKNKDTIYSYEILDRIARYSEYYRIKDNNCLITKLARNYSLIYKTREYLFETYKNDLVFLEQLSQNHSPSEIQNQIEYILYNQNRFEKDNKESFGGMNSMDFNNL